MMKTNHNHAGYRLDKLELVNWGTFDEKVWSLDLNCQTALLTGKNGSGKSTILDALITLLVPRVSRNYNQAAGNKRERDLKSYVQGAFKQSSDSDLKSEYLRDKTTYTVILSVFKNERLQQTISLAHLYWWHGQDLSSRFIIGERQLSISDDFAIKNMREFQKSLQKDDTIKMYRQFNQYAHHFRKLFHFRSEKAQDLINQIVAIKEIGDLNQFVRRHMLEALDIQEHIDKLERSFGDLNATYEAMQKAQDQLERLIPMLAEAQSYREFEQRITEAETLIEALPYYFAHTKAQMLQDAIQELDTDLKRLFHDQKQCDQLLQSLREEKSELDYAAKTNDVKRQLDDLSTRIQTANREINLRKNEFNKYSQLIQPFKLPDPTTITIFQDNQQKLQARREDLEGKLDELREDFAQFRYRENALNDEIKQLRSDIGILRRTDTQIDVRLIELRHDIASAINIPVADLPFVGELLQVRKSEKPWEASIERFLHGFGLQLIVPEVHYVAVSQYVDATNLKKRIIYNRIQKLPSMPNETQIDRASVYYKVETKPQSTYEAWLRDKLATSFNYICCETLAQFRHEVRALSINGQVKHQGNRHEKDDSRPFGNVSNYVLGWDNKEKIVSMEIELSRREQALHDVKIKLKDINDKEKRYNRLRDDVIALVNHEDFEKIDWQSQALIRDRLDEQRQALKTSSTELQLLEQQLAQKQSEIREQDKQSKQYISIIAVKERDYKQYNADLQAIASITDNGLFESYETVFSTIVDDLDEIPSLRTIDKMQLDQQGFYNRRASRYRNLSGNSQKEIVVMMQKFKNRYAIETNEIDADIASLYWYEELHQQIEIHDLPSYRERFYEYLETTMATSVMVFKSRLEEQQDNYQQSIEHLNHSLHNIPYTEATYIRLSIERAEDAEIRKFRLDLTDCLPDPGRQDDSLGLEKFEKIRNIIQMLSNPEERRWRLHVTDVRNWLDFSAEEIWRDTQELKELLRSSSGKSGGQKAKLAYTILASAVAYQFALDDEYKKDEKFRFMMVDEVFSRSDTRNSHFAMKLFESLGLQVLVVTPDDKIQIVTPYIGACCIVQNNEEGNCSEVITLSIQQLEELQTTGRLGA